MSRGINPAGPHIALAALSTCQHELAHPAPLPARNGNAGFKAGAYEAFCIPAEKTNLVLAMDRCYNKPTENGK